MKTKIRLPVYMNWATKKRVESLKYLIWKETGRSVSYSQIFRDAINDYLDKPEKTAKKYKKDDENESSRIG